VLTNIHFTNTNNIFEPSKNTTKILGAVTQIFLRSHNSIYENKFNFQHATWFTQELSIPNDFSLHFKVTMTMTLDQVFFERETNANDDISWYFDTCTFALCSNKLACVCSWTCDVCATMSPLNITYAKNDNSKVKSLNDGPTLCKKFQNAFVNFIWSYMLCCST